MDHLRSRPASVPPCAPTWRTRGVCRYASGAITISDVQLEGAKSSLAYKVISKMAQKESAVSTVWSGGYVGKAADYSEWLLKRIGEVTIPDALHALKVHLTPLFDASATLVVTCPTSKAEALAAGLAEEHGAPVCHVTEEQLNATFGRTPAPGSAPPEPPQTKGGLSKRNAFAFAKQFKCECPKCVPSV
jgi:hypothetical protein